MWAIVYPSDSNAGHICWWNGVVWDSWIISGYFWKECWGSASDDIWFVGYRISDQHQVVMHITHFGDESPEIVDLPDGTGPGFYEARAGGIHYAGGKYYVVGNTIYSGSPWIRGCLWTYDGSWSIQEFDTEFIATSQRPSIWVSTMLAIPPYLEAQDPVPDAVDVSEDKIVTFRIRDDETYVDPTTVMVYVRKLPGGLEEDAYGSGGFIAPYDGPSSSFDAYASDGYALTVDRTTDYDSYGLYQFRIVASDSDGNPMMPPIDRWSFSIVDYTPPYLEAQDPAPNAVNVPENKIVTFRIRDDETSVDPITVRVYVQKSGGIEETAYDGSNFVAPYNGPSSSFDAYASDGYALAVDRTADYDSYGLYQFRVAASDVYGNPLVYPDDRWSFRITDYISPYLEAQDPVPDATHIAANTLVSCRVRDAGSGVIGTTVKAYVQKMPSGIEETAYDGSSFITPYDGLGSSLTPYVPDGYTIVIDRTSDYDSNSTYQIRMEAQDAYGNHLPSPVGDRWSFSIVDYTPPYLEALYPIPHANVAADTLVSCRIRDDETYVNPISVRAYIRKLWLGTEELVFDGSNFVAPYNGPESSFSPYASDGYAITIDKTSNYEDGTYQVRIEAQDAEGTSLVPPGDRWSYTVGTGLNKVYFSDGYGLKVIEIEDLVGESQSMVSSLLSMDTVPSLPSNNISCISGSYVDGYYFLTLSMIGASQSGSIIGLMTWGEGIIGDWPSAALFGQMMWGQDVIGSGLEDEYGTVIVKNEVESVNTYATGMLAMRAQMNERGILYMINRTKNRIEVYYGAHFRDGISRNPDFIYDETSTPALMPGFILDLLVVNNASVREFNDPEGTRINGTRIFVGTDEGMTRIDTWDQEGTDGYCGGMDIYGIAVNYGIAGSGAQYELIGGTVPQVTRIACDQNNVMLFVATFDGTSIGGISQINMLQNKRTIFMTKETNSLPSNDVRDIFGKTY
jgi:hypothetical protein